MLTRFQRRRQKAAAIIIQNKIRDHKFVAAQKDPITLDNLETPVFRCVGLHTNHVHYFQVQSLIDYLRATGDFRNPLDRQPFHPVQIRMLEKIALRFGCTGADSLVHDMDALENKRRRQIDYDNIVGVFYSDVETVLQVGLEVCAAYNFSVYEVCIMLVNWCCRFKIACLKLLIFSQRMGG